jgi:P4 family phage/plasmid primase-like protien
MVAAALVLPHDKGSYGYKHKKTPLTRKEIDQSILSNSLTVGTATTENGTHLCKCPVIDIDNHNRQQNIVPIIRAIYDTAVKAGFHPLIEASSGDNVNDGCHLLFPCQPTLSAYARKALQKIILTSGVEGADIEVFPKQDTVEPDRYGNFCKLPFQYHNKTGKRSCIIYPGTMRAFERPDAINYIMSCPDNVFSEIPGREHPIPPITEAPKQSPESIKSDISFDERFCLKNIKPCIIKAYNDKWMLHGKGDEGHNFRLAVAGNLLYHGASDQQVRDYFRIQSDFSWEVITDQVRSIKTYLAGNKKPIGCRTILENCPGLLNGMCGTCPKKPKEKQIKQIKAIVDDDIKEALNYKDNYELAVEMQKIQPIYFDKSLNYWKWERKLKCWKMIDKTDILNAIHNRTGEYVVDSKTAGEILRAIEMTGRERIVKEIPKSILRFNDKGYDRITQSFIEPTEEYFYTSPIPHDIGTCEDTPTIDKLFASWTENPAILHEIAAYTLIDDYPIHRMFILLGSGGNGKSEYMEFLSRLVGYENRTSTDLNTIITSRFEAAKLYKKKLALVGETNYARLDSTDKLKKITGQDCLQGEYKLKMPFDFYNTAPVVISSNDLPETTDKTDGFYRRSIVIEFRGKFDDKGKRIIDTIPESEYENFVRKSIRVLNELLERGSFTGEGTTQDKAEKYERLSNPFETFQQEILREDDILRETPVSDLREDYNLFAKMKGFRPMNEAIFGEKMRKSYETARKWFGSKQRTVVLGVYAELSCKIKPATVKGEQDAEIESVSVQTVQGMQGVLLWKLRIAPKLVPPAYPAYPAQTNQEITNL